MTRKARRRFRGVLFDLYDTIVWLDVARSNDGRQRLADRLGVPLELFLQTWRRSVNDRMLGKGGTLAEQLGATAAELGVLLDEQTLAEVVTIERQRLEESVHLYPSSVPVLRKLAASGYRLGLVSNVSDGAAIPIAHLGIDRLFHEMILSHEVALLKPDPAIFELACRRLQVSPLETVFVADGGFGELDAAHQLGIFCVMLEQERQSKDFGSSSRYDVKIHDLRELEGLLGIPS